MRLQNIEVNGLKARGSRCCGLEEGQLEFFPKGIILESMEKLSKKEIDRSDHQEQSIGD